MTKKTSALIVCMSAFLFSLTGAYGAEKYVREFDAVAGPASDGIEAWVKFALAKKGKNFKNAWLGEDYIKLTCRETNALSIAVSLNKDNIGNFENGSKYKSRPLEIAIAGKKYKVSYFSSADLSTFNVFLFFGSAESESKKAIRGLYDGAEMAISIPEMEKTAIIWSGEKNGRAKDALGQFYQLCKNT